MIVARLWSLLLLLLLLLVLSFYAVVVFWRILSLVSRLPFLVGVAAVPFLNMNTTMYVSRVVGARCEVGVGDGGRRPGEKIFSVPYKIQGEGKGAYSCVACLSRSTIDHASLSRRNTVLPPLDTDNRDTSNRWALIAFFSLFVFSIFYTVFFANLIPFLFRCL